MRSFESTSVQSVLEFVDIRYGGNWNSPGYGSGRVPTIQVVESADLFQTVKVRFDGSTFWFDSIETRQDPTLSGWLKECLKRSLAPANLKRSGLTAQQRHAYTIDAR